MEADDKMRTPSSSNAEEAIIECGVCGFTGPESLSLAHSDAEHAMRPVYECGFCGFAFWKEFDLTLHRRGVHMTPRGKPARECMFCAVLFDTPDALNSHLREVHAPLQPIMCRFCGVLCHGGDTIARHIHETHTKEFLYCDAAKSFDSTDSLDGEAGRCTAFFMSSVARAEHMTVCHGVSQTNCNQPVAAGDAINGGLFMENGGPGAPISTHDALMKSAHVTEPSPVRAPAIRTQMDVPMDDPLDVPMSDAIERVSLARNEASLTRLSHVRDLSFACVVCGLRMSRVKDLSTHMSLLHRTCEAAPVDITHESHEAAVSESLRSPDCRKGCARALVSKRRQKNKPCKPARWTSELDKMFLREIREKGFSNDTLAAFQVLHTADRSMASLRARGYQKGFRMVQSNPKGS